MTQNSKSPVRYFLFALLLIGIDQASKLLVHKYMAQGFAGQIRLIGDWFKLYYVTNPGMAFGMQIEHEYGKLFLTLFRLGAMVFIAAYIVRLAKKNAPSGLLWAMSMILAGAIGNLVDSIFYGVWLRNAPIDAPTPWFHGQVIDMIFIDFWEGFVPDWIPFWGGQYYTTPIFNIADSCIFVGVCIILIFQGTFFPRLEEESDYEHIVQENNNDNFDSAQPTEELSDKIISKEVEPKAEPLPSSDTLSEEIKDESSQKE